MSKEYLEALNYLTRGMFPQFDTPQYKVVKQALTRLEAIDNAKPSEAIKCLECLYAEARIESGWVKKHCITYAEEFEHNNRIKPYYDTIKQTLLKAQEQEKVLEIIKEKKVDIIRIKHLIFKSQKNPKYWDLRYYNEARVIDDEKLTQEEFELLKRYFEKNIQK